MKQRLAFVVTIVVLVGLLIVPLGTRAQEPAGLDGDIAARVAAARAALRNTAVDPDATAARLPRLLRPDGTIKVVVELDDPPVVVAVAEAQAQGLASVDATAVGQARLNRIQRDQRTTLQRLQSLDNQLQIIYQTQRVLNGIAIKVDAGQLAAIRALPGVKAVYPLIPETLHHTSSVPLIGAPDVWQGANGAAGAGITIGIIDTGIDYHHVNFGGPGDGYELNNPTIITDGFDAYFGPGAVKIKGGYDFAGDDYDAGDPDNDTPRPDPDPLDCDGHGTHVAGTAAGFGTTTARATFAGPYDAPIDFDSLYIGPGTAPLADLYALRVFGCAGSTNLTAQALEWAVDPNGDGDTSDRLDVVNMSLGSSFGEPSDPTIIASDNAARAGVIVVASAGNSGNVHYITGSPGASSYAISVASSQDQRDIVDAFEVNSPPAIAGPQQATFSTAYPWRTSADVTGDLIYLPGISATGCSTGAGTNPYAPGSLTGRVLLVDWAPEGTSNFPCGSAVRTNNAANAGAVGIIMASGLTVFDTAIFGNDRIPAVFTTFDVGQTLRTALSSDTVSITFSESYRNSIVLDDPTQEDTLSGFSSRGPRVGDSVLKPDITAPGDSIFSAASITGSEGVSFNGTSMAAPHIAGVMALLRELNPTLSVTELKALVMNTAVNNLFGSTNGQPPLHAPQRVGTGRVDVPRAAAGQVIMYNAEQPELVSLSFGALEVRTPTVLTKTLTVRNLGASAASYVTSFVPGSTVSGVSYSVTPAVVNVPARGTATINVTLNADPALMRHTPDTLLETAQGGLPRHYLAEASGLVALYAAAPTSFAASLSGLNEVPPVNTPRGGVASFSYNPGTNTLAYTIRFSQNITIAGTGSNLRRGPAGSNGPVAVALLANGAYNADTDYTGTVTLTDADEALLYSGGLYANFHTAAFPAGEIRGQVVPVTTPNLRVGAYTTARPASAMTAAPDTLGFFNRATGNAEIDLSGTGLATGTALPVDLLSLVTSFELQHLSGKSTTGITSTADLAAVGVNSDLAAAGSVGASTLYFGIASHADWSSPHLVEFDVYIDTNGSGVAANGVGAEFVLFNWNVGSATGSGINDVFVTVLVNLTTERAALEDFVNIVPASVADTVPFNTNVMVLPVTADSLGLTSTASRVNYRVFSFSGYTGLVDATGQLSYDPARPGISFGDSPEFIIGPAYADLDGGTIPISYNRANYSANRSRGVLLLHHHNETGAHVETVVVNPRLFLPLLTKR